MSEEASGIDGVFVAMTTGGVSPVVLISLTGERVLPIYIGLWEALSIESAPMHEVPPRPFTHDLFAETLQRFGISVKNLQIDSLEEGVYYATLLMEQGGREMRLDCRPSDGIAIAARCGASIFIDDAVISAAVVKKGDLSNLAELSGYLPG